MVTYELHVSLQTFRIALYRAGVTGPQFPDSARYKVKLRGSAQMLMSLRSASLSLPLVSREWKNGSNGSYNCTPFLHSLPTKGKFQHGGCWLGSVCLARPGCWTTRPDAPGFRVQGFRV